LTGRELRRALIVLKATVAIVEILVTRGEAAMELHWFVWFVVGAMTTFAVVLGATALLTREK
jgi:hypothetical protein